MIGAPRERTSRAPVAPDENDEKLRALVEYLARGLVDHPDDVLVEIATPGDDGDLELRVHQEDMGHVIGKQGRTARSLRLALGAAAAKLNRRMSLEIED